MAGTSFFQGHVPNFRPSNGGGAGVRRMIFTNKASSTYFTRYVPGSGVGAKTISARNVLIQRSKKCAN